MNLQFITDFSGKTTGVLIPIKNWIKMLNRYKDLREEMSAFEIPDWHQQIVSDRLEAYQKNPGETANFSDAVNNIEKNL
jgi:hypothetical protein